MSTPHCTSIPKRKVGWIGGGALWPAAGGSTAVGTELKGHARSTEEDRLRAGASLAGRRGRPLRRRRAAPTRGSTATHGDERPDEGAEGGGKNYVAEKNDKKPRPRRPKRGAKSDSSLELPLDF